MHRGLTSILGRFIAAIGIILLVGVVLRLIVGILEPVLPAGFMHDLSSGWGLLYSILSPALAPIYALLIVAGFIWVAIGKR